MDIGFILMVLMFLFVQNDGQVVPKAVLRLPRASYDDCYYYDYWGYMYNWSAWSSWSSCDHTCGGGQRIRTRCNNNLVTDRSSCGQNCFNHGTFINEKCQCNVGFKGYCCEVMPVCQPVCENNDVCIGNNVCKCSPGYYGQRCEIGSNFKERLLPKLNPAIPIDTIHQELSWYDSPDYDSGNKVCYIKVHTQNAPHETIFTAESIMMHETTDYFGNFTTAPIDSSAGMNDSSRFACLQVRCPGTLMIGKEFDILVRVSLETQYKHCHIRYQGKKTLNMNVSSSQLESDTFTVVLENGKNYGPLYGVYFYTGFRDKAQYLVQRACYSGHDYDYNHFIPTNGILAEYIC